MSTPIEVLFHHGANCACEQCQLAVKPFRNGKFLSKEEIDQINSDIQGLIQENRKLQAMLEKLTEEKVLIQQAEQERHAAVAEEEEAKQLQKAAPSPKNLTITIDTSNIIYIVVITVLLIMVIKK